MHKYKLVKLVASFRKCLLTSIVIKDSLAEKERRKKKRRKKVETGRKAGRLALPSGFSPPTSNPLPKGNPSSHLPEC